MERTLDMKDTSIEIQQQVSKMLMELSEEERFIRGALMFDAAREMILASFPANLPQEELKARLFERIYGFPLPKAI